MGAKARRGLVEAVPRIDVREMRRAGFVVVGDRAIVVSSDAGVTQIDLVHIERPVIGGQRTYLVCPTCRQRADLLYRAPHLACRKCHRLGYASENEDRIGRSVRAIEKRRRRLGQQGFGILDPLPRRRRWMRWATYLRDIRATREREQAHWAATARALGLAPSHAEQNET